MLRFYCGLVTPDRVLFSLSNPNRMHVSWLLIRRRNTVKKTVMVRAVHDWLSRLDDMKWSQGGPLLLSVPSKGKKKGLSEVGADLKWSTEVMLAAEEWNFQLNGSQLNNTEQYLKQSRWRIGNCCDDRDKINLHLRRWFQYRSDICRKKCSKVGTIETGNSSRKWVMFFASNLNFWIESPM